ncbi:helix-turn-helix domain-containing protein [Streptomyces racemochromogenes]|uniref:Helix-turn-helix domain-containing protein n=1 Tax=Streptomyces racemochromogenes TaxID=67353 RepID=A0ABW7P8R6_9ACTN
MAGPLEEFAHELRGLRRQAGNPSYRTMAKRAHYSVATLAEAARGLHKPSLKVTLAYVAACGGDPEPWTRRWNRLSSELAESDRPSGGRPASTAAGPAAARPGAGRGPLQGEPASDSRAAAFPPTAPPPPGALPRQPAPPAAGPRSGGPRRTGSGTRAAASAGAAARRPAGDALTPDERAELRRLRDEVEELRHANEVLKAASAIFAADLRTKSQVVYNPADRQDPLP